MFLCCSGVQNKLIQRQLCIPTQDAAPDIPFYRKPWRIFVAVLLERKPIISKDLSDLEKRFYAFQSNLEYEQSALSNHEVNKLKLMKGSKQTKKKTTEEEEQRRLECEQELSRIEVPLFFFLSNFECLTMGITFIILLTSNVFSAIFIL